VLCGLLEAQRSGQGQVVDAAMVEGAASLMAPFFGLVASGTHDRPRGENTLDSGAPFYEVYECADGGWLSLAPIERRFRREMVRLVGVAPSAPDCADPADRAELKRLIAARIATKPLAEWCAILEGSDACAAPVLSIAEAPAHPHNRARGSFVEIDGIVQPAPAPRFSRTVPATPTPPEPAGASTAEALVEWGCDAATVARLLAAGVIGRDGAAAG